MDISIRIGGKAGQGIQSISSIIAKTFVRYDFFVFINQDAESRIRGGHNFDQIRISNNPVCAVSDKVDILIALDDEAIQRDLDCLDDDGLLLFDGDEIDFPCEDFNHFCVPFARIAKEVGKSKIMINSVATGAAVAMMDFKLQPVLDCLQERFQQKGPETVENNQKAVNDCIFVLKRLKSMVVCCILSF